MQDAAEKFFACTESDMQELYAERAANQPADPKLLIKQQFVMNKNESVARKYHHSAD